MGPWGGGGGGEGTGKELPHKTDGDALRKFYI